MQHTHHAPIGARTGNDLHLPHALTAIAAVLFQYPRTLLYSRWKGIVKFLGAPVQVRVGAPAEMFGTPQHFLDAHLQNDIGMGADPGPARGDLTQHWVEL